MYKKPPAGYDRAGGFGFRSIAYGSGFDDAQSFPKISTISA